MFETFETKNPLFYVQKQHPNLLNQPPKMDSDPWACVMVTNPKGGIVMVKWAEHILLLSKAVWSLNCSLHYLKLGCGLLMNEIYTDASYLKALTRCSFWMVDFTIDIDVSGHLAMRHRWKIWSSCPQKLHWACKNFLKSAHQELLYDYLFAILCCVVSDQ